MCRRASCPHLLHLDPLGMSLCFAVYLYLFLVSYLPLTLICSISIVELSNLPGEPRTVAAREFQDPNPPIEASHSSSVGSSVTTSIPSFFGPYKKSRTAPKQQMRLCGNSVDPAASARMNVAIADFIHSHLLPFNIAGDPKLMRIIDIARTLGPAYTPPHRNEISGSLLSKLYEFNWDKQMSSILVEAKIFGVTVFGDGATIKSVPLVNVLAAGANNPFALLDIADCTDHCSSGGKKDAPYIAGLVEPWITKMESEVDAMKKHHRGIVDLVFFDGASNVQNAGRILASTHPRITVGHGAEHVVSLFFSDVFRNVREFFLLSTFYKTCHNIWGSTRHLPAAMFKAHSKRHNNGVNIGFIKSSECRMAGEHIALLRLLSLKDALQSTITSPEFIHMNQFKSTAAVLMREEFWKYLFVMCRALYAPMRLLRLADQKIAAMDKVYYYVLQTDRMLPFWLDDAQKHAAHLITDETVQVFEGGGDTVNANGNNVEADSSADEDDEDDDDVSAAGSDAEGEEENDDSDEEGESL